jgi:hypothetical protein
MDLHWIFACSGPGAAAAINRNQSIYLVCASLIALMFFGIFKLQFRDKGIRFSAAASCLAVIVFYLAGPHEGGDCGYSDRAWALTITPIIAVLFVFQVIYKRKETEVTLTLNLNGKGREKN